MASLRISTQQTIFKVSHALFIFLIIYSTQLSFAQDSAWPKYSAKEQVALKQFRPLVSDTLYRDYMKDDVYLVKWLRASDYDLGKAVMKLRKAHEWRKSSKIDSVLNEDFSKFEKAYPFISDGQDLDGRPIGIIPVGAWNVRKIVLSGQGAKYSRNLNRLIELLESKARSGFNSSESVKNGKRDLADWIFIADLNGYSIRQHACLPCLPIEFAFVTELDSYYPVSAKQMILVNMPRIFESALRLSMNLVSQKVKDTVQVFGFDKTQFSAALLRNIAPDQLPIAYGGTRIKRSN